MTKKRLCGGSSRCGKTIGQYTCPECKLPLRRLNTTLFQCPVCLKKVKALAKEIPSDYGHYTERRITKSDCKYYRESDGNCLNFTYVGEYDPCTDGDLEHCYEKFPHFFNKELYK